MGIETIYPDLHTLHRFLSHLSAGLYKVPMMPVAENSFDTFYKMSDRILFSSCHTCEVASLILLVLSVLLLVLADRKEKLRTRPFNSNIIKFTATRKPPSYAKYISLVA